MLRWTGFTAGPLLGLFCLMPKMVKKNKVDIVIDLAEGNKKFTAWTSDLTEEYIRINADYSS